MLVFVGSVIPAPLIIYLVKVSGIPLVFWQGMIALNGIGLRALPTGRGKVKPVDCPKKRWQEEAGKEKRY